MSDEPRQCARCGETIPETDAIVGACPRCMLEIGLEPPSQFDAEEPGGADGQETDAGDRSLAIARYRILKVIGEGGMGTVYEAEQDHPRRTVALKIIKPGLSNPKLLRRFEQESQALGRLQHPGIAQIYEAGTADTGLGPQPYFAMELIRGKTLEAHAEAFHLTARQRLEMVARVAEAVHHAHQRGVIHRDLKPGNIIVDETGQPKVLDFGIARAIDSDTRATSQTDVGQLMGTLNYMSPEQTLADPLEIDTRSDVYALGVMLYELLAGRLPYSAAKTLPDTVRAIRDEEPVRLGVVNRHYRGDIETIVAAALEKDKTRRYGSAADLAADIRRYLADQPIVARPPTAAYQLRKFARRNRTLVTGMAAVFVVLILGVVVSLWLAAVADRERDGATAAKEAATAERNAAIEAERRATAAEAAATLQRNAAIEAERRATRELGRALAAETQLRQDRDRIVWQNLARESIRLSATRADDDLAALLARQAFLLSSRATIPSRTTLVEDALQQAGRATPWSHSFPTSRETNIAVAALSPDGTQLATNGPDGSVEVWALGRPGTPSRVLRGAPGQGPVQFAAFSPDGTRLATGGQQSTGARGSALVAAPVKIWDLRAASPSAVLLHGHARSGRGGAFSPDGTHLMTTDLETVLLWDLRNLAAPTKKVLQQPQQPPRPTTSVAISPDGSRLATAHSDGVRVWDMRNPIRPTTVLPDSQGGLRVAFSTDGSWLALAARDGVRLWDLPRGGPPRVLVFESEQVGMVAFSRDGARLAAGVGSTVHIWDLRNPAAAPLILRGHQGVVLPVAFSPDGSRVVSGANDRTVRIWELQRAGAPLLLPQGAQGGAPQTVISRQTVTFSVDGSRLYSGTPNGAVRMWDLQPAVAAPALLLSERMPALTTGVGGRGRGPSDLRVMDLSADGTRIALAALGVQTRVWNVRNPAAPPLQLPEPDGASTGSAFDPTHRIQALRLSPSGSELALSRAGSDTVELWDLRNLTARFLPLRASPGATGLVFSPDGSRLAAGSQLEVRVWDLSKPDSPPVVISQPPQPRAISSMALSMDNSRLAVGREDVRVWDLRNPAAVPLLLRGFPSQGFYALAFSPDGGILAGGSSNARTQLWDLRSPTSPPVSLPGQASSIAFAPNGRQLAIGELDGSVRLWSLGSAAADYLCTRVWRNLSMDEWRLYVGESTPYERTCPALPPGSGAH